MNIVVIGGVAAGTKAAAKLLRQDRTAQVTVYTKSGKSIDATIEVNRPLEVEGWKIYQLSYDERLGRWSDTSVFELVSDPWLEWVYVGIYLVLAGALLNFLTTRKR